MECVACPMIRIVVARRLCLRSYAYMTALGVWVRLPTPRMRRGNRMARVSPSHSLFLCPIRPEQVAAAMPRGSARLHGNDFASAMRFVRRPSKKKKEDGSGQTPRPRPWALRARGTQTRTSQASSASICRRRDHRAANVRMDKPRDFSAVAGASRLRPVSRAAKKGGV